MVGSADLARHQNRAAGASKVGGRVDVTKDINEIRLTGSVTDATARDYEVGELLILLRCLLHAQQVEAMHLSV